MRKLILLAALAASFALYGNEANACAHTDHAIAQQSIADSDTVSYFEQAAPASDNHHAHHNHADHDRASCDGSCGCAVGAAVALLASEDLAHPATRSASHLGALSNIRPRQLTGDFYGPPKSFA